MWRFLFLAAAVVNVTGADAATPNGTPPSIANVPAKMGTCAPPCLSRRVGLAD
jgi:hypothetical protein